MREKVEAPRRRERSRATGVPGTRGFRVLGWGAGKREPPAEILSGAPLGAQSKDQILSEAEGSTRSNHA
jgi:hypothetical protein